MRQILLIGIGQTGSTIAELFLKKFNSSDARITALAIDTDEEALSKVEMAQKIAMTNDVRLGAVVEELGEDEVKSYFPCDWDKDMSTYIKELDMSRGTGLWRMKSLLAFDSFLSEEKKASKLHFALDELCEAVAEEGEIEIYTVSSLAGGTGSGLLLPIALYVKQYLRNKGARIGFSNAYLAMPDIYKNELYAERGKKSCANAYATLRELNAINTVAFSEKQPSTPPVDFKIVLSHGEFKTLFDAKDEKFHTKDAAPFDKVTLYESIPTVVSVSDHIGIMANSLFIAVNNGREELLNKKTDETVIASESFTRICYPHHCVIDYIMKQQLYTFASEEIGKTADLAEKQLSCKRLAAKDQRRKLNETVETYRDSYIQTVEAILENNDGLPEAILGRRLDENAKPDLPADLQNEDWILTLERALGREFKNEYLTEIENIIDEYNRADKKERAAKKKDMLEFVEHVKALLSGAFKKSQEILAAEKEKFLSGLVCSEGESEFSLVKELLCENGRYLSPAYALYRLCLAHKKLEKYKNEISYVPEKAKENYPFPENILSVLKSYDEENANGKVKHPKTNYFKGGTARFSCLVGFEYGSKKETERKSPKELLKEKKAAEKARERIADDKATFIKDVEYVTGRLADGIKHYRYVDVVETLEKLIEKYRKLIDGIYDMRDEIAADVSIALINGSSSNAITVNVGATSEEKISYYRNYNAAYYKNVAEMTENDTRIAHKAAMLVLSDLENASVGKPELRDLFLSIEEIYKESLEKTELYKTVIDRNILSAMEDSVNGSYGECRASYEQMFATRYTPLKTCNDGKIKRNAGVISESKVILSEEIERMLSEENGADPADIIKEAVSDYTEYGTVISFLAGVSDKEIFLRKTHEGHLLPTVEFLNEANEDGTGYKAYRESIELQRSYQSCMWNTSQSFDREEKQLLPYISVKMQSDFGVKAAKAVIYALMHKEIFVHSNEIGKKAYYLSGEFESRQLLVGDESVKSGDISSLMLWAHMNVEWTEINAARFDKETDKKAARQLFETVFGLLSGLDKQNADTGYAYSLASVLNTVNIGFYLDVKGELTERSSILYAKELSEHLDAIKEKLGDSLTEKLTEAIRNIGVALERPIK